MMASTHSPIPATPAQLQALSLDLIALGERLEQSGSADWLPVARPAALVDGLRHNFVTVVPHGHG